MSEKGKRFVLSKEHSRTLALVGLCALLVASSFWGAESKNAQTFSLPITQVEASQTGTAQPEPTESAESTTVLGSFTTYKLEMDAARQQSIRMLDDLIGDERADQTTVEQARAEKLELAKSMSMEATLQGLVAARGYGETYVTVRSGSVNVVVKNPDLSEAQTASILEMVTRETGESPENVKIIAAK